MKVRCIQDYYDLELNRSVKRLEEFEVSEERGRELNSVKNKAKMVLVEIIDTTPTEVVTEAEPEVEAEVEVVTEEAPKPKRGRKPKKEAK